jgi:hypothetical protein
MLKEFKYMINVVHIYNKNTFFVRIYFITRFGQQKRNGKEDGFSNKIDSKTVLN